MSDAGHEVEIVGGPPAVSFETLREACRAYLRETGVVKAIVFGSFARGDADCASDLDLVLIEETTRPFAERGVAHRPLFRLGIGVDLLVYTPAEYRRLQAEGHPLVDRIEREGITIHARPEG